MMLPKMCREEVEGSLRKKLPFDDDILQYLLKVAPLSAPAELLELVNDFCPRWSLDDQGQLAAKLLEYVKTMPTRSEAAEASWDSQPNVQQSADPDPPMYDEAADMLLAQMLQDEDDADDAFRRASQGNVSSKRGKKNFKPLNINYTVGTNA